MFIWMQKMNSIPNFFFEKILQTCYFEYFKNAWSCQSIMKVSLYRKFWYPKCWNQLAGNFNVYLHTKHQLNLFLFFQILQRRCKHDTLVTLKMLDHPHQKCRKFSCLSACKKSTSALASFLRYCKGIVTLLFSVIWACLATFT